MNDDHDRDPKPAPTLFGLTADQLEGLRGYVETVQVIKGLGEIHVFFQMAEGASDRGVHKRRHRERRDSVIRASMTASPHGEGVRFALAARREEWNDVKEDPKRAPV